MKVLESDKGDIINMYSNELVSMIDIGKLYGVTRKRVWQILKAAGVDTSKRHLPVTCTACGTITYKPKCQIRTTKRPFCSAGCYHAWLSSRSNSVYWRHGMRAGRRVVSELFDLQPEHVVHHVDGDNHNNHPSNLAVFACQGDHIRFHRGFDAAPIWEG